MFNGVVPMAAPIMQILSRSLCSVRLLCFFTVLGVLAMAGAATAQADRLISIGSRDSLWSDVLGEERPYWVYLPASYDDARYALVDYPVLYLLDGDTHFHLATGVVQFMSEGANANIQIPEMIVVGVPSANRTRDHPHPYDQPSKRWARCDVERKRRRRRFSGVLESGAGARRRRGLPSQTL